MSDALTFKEIDYRHNFRRIDFHLKNAIKALERGSKDDARIFINNAMVYIPEMVKDSKG